MDAWGDAPWGRFVVMFLRCEKSKAVLYVTPSAYAGPSNMRLSSKKQERLL